MLEDEEGFSTLLRIRRRINCKPHILQNGEEEEKKKVNSSAKFLEQHRFNLNFKVNFTQYCNKVLHFPVVIFLIRTQFQFYIHC